MSHDDLRPHEGGLSQDDTQSVAGEPDPRLLGVLTQCEEQLRAGQPIDREALLEAHPDLRDELNSCLAALEFIHRAGLAGNSQASGSAPDVRSQPVIGGFRIVREIGRGGMGVVYEAEQVRLKRPVALKILRHGDLGDEKIARRFRREAETVARLHHTNIVPIHEVGDDRGVHYYAMQLIDGESLAQRIERQRHAEPDAHRFRQVAEFGRQAAEALAHAHSRGVIHRDIKPGNLLVDENETLWITDFGLARHVDDVTLTLSGAVLGTPRYMSPEQVEARAPDEVDHRSDIYSLGVSLYELLVGRPAFEGSSTRDVMERIRDGRPTAPRAIWPRVPRDLETIILKAMARDPDSRYADAASLASDFRAYLQGGAIQARRPGPIRRLRLWLKRHRQSAAVSVISMGTLALVVAVLAVGWFGYWRWREGKVLFLSSGRSFTGEIADARGRVVEESFTIPQQKPLALPSGEYRLNIAGTGFLGRQLLFTIERGRSTEHTISPAPHRPWAPLRIPGRLKLLGDAAGGVDLVVVSEDGVQRMDGKLGVARWKARLDGAGGLTRFRWYGKESYAPSGIGKFGRTPWLLETADLDADGQRDLVIACRHTAVLIACSAANGNVLWARDAVAAMARDRELSFRPSSALEDVQNAVVLEPVLADVDGDDVTDIVATFQSLAKSTGEDVRWIEAVSGVDGELIWRTVLPAEWFAGEPSDAVPQQARWFHGLGSGIQVRVTDSWPRGWSRRLSSWKEQPSAVLPVQQGTDRDAGPAFVCVAGEHVVWLRGADGHLAGEAVSLGARPHGASRVADVDRDGDDEVLVLLAPTAADGEPAAASELIVMDPEESKPLWTRSVAADPGYRHWHEAVEEWPLVEDVDANGLPEVLLPWRNGKRQMGIELLDGSGGERRWRVAIADQADAPRNVSLQVERCVVVRDVDGDGVRDVALGFFGAHDWNVELVVELRSGRDGSQLWRWTRALEESIGSTPGPAFEPIRSWGDGGDALVTVCVTGGDASAARAFFLQSRDGKLASHTVGISRLRLADLDGEGMLELLGLELDDVRFQSGPAVLHVSWKPPSLRWHRLGAAAEPVADLDGDGSVDLARIESGLLQAFGGQNGRRLWASAVTDGPRRLPRFEGSGRAGVELARQEDLDGDGRADLFTVLPRIFGNRTVFPLAAHSGVDGSLLWEATGVPLHRSRPVHVVAVEDLEGDGQKEVLFAGAMDWDGSDAPVVQTRGAVSERYPPWLVALDAENGSVRWATRLLDDRVSLQEPPLVALDDVDGDGVLDAIVSIAGIPSTRLLAVSGREGRILWRTELSRSDDEDDRSRRVPFPVVQRSGGRATAFCLDIDVGRQADGTGGAALRAFDARTGDALWVRPIDAVTTVDASPQRLRCRPRVVTVRRSGSPALCVWTWYPARIALYSPEGELLSERWVARQGERTNLRVWPVDSNGDGQDELLFIEGDALQLTGVDLNEPLWSTRLPGHQAFIQDVWPGRDGRDAVVWVRGSLHTESGFSGYALRSDKLLWRHEHARNPVDLGSQPGFLIETDEMFGIESGVHTSSQGHSPSRDAASR